jgi:DNA-directed RNA polymerase subunit M/transcription elongation factor TFIIS
MPVEALKCETCGRKTFRWTSREDGTTDNETSETFLKCVYCGSEGKSTVTTE